MIKKKNSYLHGKYLFFEKNRKNRKNDEMDKYGK